jgi:hypothetical protein
MKKLTIWLSTAFLLFFAALPASAATISPTSGALTMTLITLGGSPTPVTFNFDGSVTADVFDPGFIGSVVLTDADGVGGVDPFPQLGLLGVNAIPPTEAILFAFNGGTVGTIPAIGVGTASVVGSASPLGPLTNPGLTSIVGAGPLTFNFAFNSVSSVVIASVPFDFYAYTFTGATNNAVVPEPATLGLLGAGLLAITLLRRRRAA